MSLRPGAAARVVITTTLCALLCQSPLFAQDAQPGQPPPPGPSGDPPGDWSRKGDTAVTPLSGGLFAYGMQYRIVYDRSNLAGPGGSTFDDASDYGFFRQRVRLNLEVTPHEQVGAFVQAEFRGGWGGTSPGVSDPRSAEPLLNPFNRIGDRGLRYSYLFWKPSPGHQIRGGVLPISDEFGDTLFSADWDWNAGGVEWLVASDAFQWRVAALSMVEGVGSSSVDTIDQDGTLLVADLSQRRRTGGDDWTFGWGAHAYVLIVQERLPLGGTQSVWLGPTATIRKSDFSLRLFGILNTGDLGTGTLAGDGTVVSGFTDAEAQGHTGFAVRAEAEKGLGKVALKGQVVFSSGDSDGEIDQRFVTPMGLFGTSGYWGYTHIFTANGPSDVNDLGVEIGNRGAGLLTVQGQGGLPIGSRAGVDVVAGWFRATEPRNGSRNMGVELSGTFRTQLAGPLRLEAGAAVAALGDFFTADADTAYELFSRFQLQF